MGREKLTPAAILEFERLYPRRDRRRGRFIRAEFGCSPVAYYQALNRLLDTEAGDLIDPELTARLRTIRDENAAERAAAMRRLALPRSTTPAAVAPRPRREAPVERISEGELRKLAGMALVDAATDPDWKTKADAAIDLLARCERRFTSEDVRELAGDPPGHPNAMGSRFSSAAKRGAIVKVGYEPAARPTLHGHPIAVWVGKSSAERGAA